MRKIVPIRVLAVVGLAGSAIAGAVVANSSAASAAKGPVAATCSSVTGSGTVAQETSGQPISSLITGCSGGKATASGVSVSTLDQGFGSGSAVIDWTNKKTTTYTFTVGTGPALSVCPTFLGVAASGTDTITVTSLGGNAKVTAPGSFNVCYWIGSDGSLYESSVGPVTL